MSTLKLKISRKTLLISGVFSLLMASCNSNLPIESMIYFFDTFVNIRLYNAKDENIKDIKKILSLYDELTDNYKTSSSMNNVFKINETNNKIEISKEAYEMFSNLKTLENNFAPYFNPLIGNLSKLWKASLAKKEVLSQEIISAELEKIQNSSYEITNENNHYFIQRNGEAQLDLGAFAKGYVLDKIFEYLNQNELNNYLIDAGNSSILLGEKPDNDGYFNVGLKDIPNSYLKLKNCFLGASGVSEQGVIINNQMYSHIINPVNGSAINNYDYVLVKGNNGALCDALSTSFMLMGLESIKTYETRYNVEAILYKNSKIIYRNNNLDIKTRN
ncbi:MAG: FAD:protein FMN transferase [Bacilli bacterium]|nr:FAD:protein FMN transferase [Bacilli bacterium]